MTITKDYGWRSEQGPTSCTYIQPAVFDALRPLKPRPVLDLGADNGALCHALLQKAFTTLRGRYSFTLTTTEAHRA